MVRYREAGLGEDKRGLTKYTSSLRYDGKIVDEVILITIAHVLELWKRGLMPERDAEKVLVVLQNLFRDETQKRRLTEDDIYEDIFEALESYVESKARESSYYLSIGRSRNDHVAGAIKLRIVREIVDLSELIANSAKELISYATENKDVPFVIHTHTMPAQPTTYMHYITSIVEELLDVIQMLLTDLNLIRKSPLGSGAGAGTSANIDRRSLAESLGFIDIVENTLYSIGSRNYISRVLSSLAILSTFLSRVSYDYILFVHPSISVIEPPVEHVQTSSIMPQKKNPATLEIARARLRRVVSNLMYVMSVESGIGLGYSLDLQELTPIVWESFEICREAIHMITDFIKKSKVNVEKVREMMAKGGIMATELAEALSIELGMPFREAHRAIASALRASDWNLERAAKIIEEKYGIQADRYLDWRSAVDRKMVDGSPSLQKSLSNIEHISVKLNELCSQIAEIKDAIHNKVSALIEVKIR